MILINLNEKKIFLSGSIIEHENIVSLNANEIFNVFIRKKGIHGINFEDILFENKVEEINYKNRAYIIKYELKFFKDHTRLYPVLFLGEKKIKDIIAKDYKKIIQNGYIIYENTWYPILEDCITIFNTILKDTKFTEKYFILSLKEGFSYYSKTNALKPYILYPDNDDIKSYYINEISNELSDNPLFIKKLYDYQVEGYNWLKFCLLNEIGTILGDDMGLGKTAQVIALISWIIYNKFANNILIVVPGTLLENWRREFNYFSPEIIPYIHHGKDRKGLASSIKKDKVIITSYSIIINDIYLLNKIQWDLIVADEASLIKNPNTDRTLHLKLLDAKNKIAMTGTPVENSLNDLWSIADFVFPGYLGEYDEFVKTFDSNKAVGYQKNLLILEEQIKKILLRRIKEDLLSDLPDKIDIHQALFMSSSEENMYDLLRKNIISEYENDKKQNILNLIIQLRKFTSHPLLVTNESISDYNQIIDQSNKLKRTIELLEEIRERKEKVLIFTTFIEMIDILKYVINKKYGPVSLNIDGRIPVKERQLIIDKFSQQSGFSVLVLNPDTAGMGLNITAANHVIHYTRQWNPALELQASARAYRNGQQKAVNIYYLYYSNTIEEIIDNRLRNKIELSNTVITKTDNKDSDMDDLYKVLYKK